MTNEKTMREAPVWKLLCTMSLPVIVIMLLQVLYNMADVFFMGRTGAAMQVAAISLAGPVFSVISQPKGSQTSRTPFITCSSVKVTG